MYFFSYKHVIGLCQFFLTVSFTSKGLGPRVFPQRNLFYKKEPEKNWVSGQPGREGGESEEAGDWLRGPPSESCTIKKWRCGHTFFCQHRPKSVMFSQTAELKVWPMPQFFPVHINLIFLHARTHVSLHARFHIRFPGFIIGGPSALKTIVSWQKRPICIKIFDCPNMIL